MNDIRNIKIFKENLTSLKEISVDNSDRACSVYMTESEIKAINFDKVKTIYANDLSLSEEVAASVDALLINQNEMIFIEFKNGNMKSEKTKIKHKVRDSLLILCDIMKCHISDTRKNLKFILVYNENKNPIKETNNQDKTVLSISKHLHNKAKTNFIRFGLEGFKSLYFKEVATYTEKEFDIFLNENSNFN